MKQPSAERPTVATSVFHAHLDECERCRTRPFDLCAIGTGLIERAGAAALSENLRTMKPHEDTASTSVIDESSWLCAIADEIETSELTTHWRQDVNFLRTLAATRSNLTHENELLRAQIRKLHEISHEYYGGCRCVICSQKAPATGMPCE